MTVLIHAIRLYTICPVMEGKYISIIKSKRQANYKTNQNEIQFEYVMSYLPQSSMF